jgi:hypothetical protein
MNIAFDSKMEARFCSVLETLNADEPEKNYVLAIILTRHHQTKDLAFGVGFQPLAEIPDGMLIETKTLPVALLMEREEMSALENSILSYDGSYVVVTPM